MGQPNLERTLFRAREEITSLVNDNRQLMAFTGYYRLGDTVDIVDVDANGCIIGLIGTRTIDAIERDTALVFDSNIDTSTATGTPYALARNIDDGQEAVDRLYRTYLADRNSCEFITPIVAQALNTPLAGQTTYEVDDLGFHKVGDSINILSDEGLAGVGTIIGVSPNADDTNNKAEIVISSLIDTSALTNPKIQLVLSSCVLISRLSDRIDLIDEPVENEDLDTPNCSHTAYKADNVFLQGSSKVFLDGVRKKLGTAGSKGSLSQGATNSQLICTSMLLGILGNGTKVSVSAGAGFTVTVSGNSTSGYTVDCTDNGGAATSKEIAEAINADTTAQRIVQVQYGGDGSGVVSTFAATNLAGGADDGTGDYAELEQVFENAITGTGYKWISFWILPGDRNRMNKPPRNTEELVIDYRTALVNS